MLKETDWIRIKQIWLGMGPDRTPRSLQGWIERNHGVKLPLPEIQAELSTRNYIFDALEHDKKIARKVDAITVDTIAERMAALRLQSFNDMNQRFKNFGEIVDKALATVIKKAEFGKVSIDEVRRLMETYLKIMEFIEDYEVPMIPEMNDEEVINARDPQALSRALMQQMKIRDMSLSGLSELHNEAAET